MSDDRTYQFVDTNVLVYAHDSSAGHKQVAARDLLTTLWDSKQGSLSIQILQEFYVTVTRKVAAPISSERATQIIAALGTWRIHSPTVEDLQGAISIQTRYDLSFWDAMVIRSANRLGCQTLWSEDLNAGQFYGDVQVVNPFADS